MADVSENNLKKDLIKKQTCFSKLSETEIQVLADLLVEKQYRKETVIVNQGDPVDSVYFIVKGTADVRRVSIDHDKEVFESLAKLKAGESIGLSETGFYSLSGIRTATVVAETDMTLFYLSIAAFNGFALAYPHVNEVMRQNG